MSSVDRPFNEFPTIVFPAWLQELGYTDASWHNDATAHAEKEFADARFVWVWVNYDEPAERETMDDWKYSVCTMDAASGDFIDTQGNVNTVEECKALIEKAERSLIKIEEDLLNARRRGAAGTPEDM